MEHLEAFTRDEAFAAVLAVFITNVSIANQHLLFYCGLHGVGHLGIPPEKERGGHPGAQEAHGTGFRPSH
jgi:hypothetical protein